MLAELKPEVERLLARVESVVEKRERRGEWLRARWALGEGRLGRDVDVPGARGSSGSDAARAAQSRKKSVGRAGAGGADEAKAKRMRQKKERLSYAVERLQLQAGQRERQLRKSMAAVGESSHDEEEGAKAAAREEEDDLDF